MLAQTPCREFANRWEPKDYFIISAIGLPASVFLQVDKSRKKVFKSRAQPDCASVCKTFTAAGSRRYVAAASSRWP